mmetsp:Transcript_23355/g.32658  ORF Transcript_23355/g.32658 Transcript_23355/m.32658 type:complete len:193 (-) Transcript_23355:283-861(-)
MEQLQKLCCCLRVYFPCLFEPHGTGSTPLVSFSDVKGPRVRISNFFVTGHGTALVNVPVIQNRAYWEFKIIETGNFCVGVCEPSKASLDGQLSDRKRTWAISSKATKRDLKKGDTIGLAYDLSDIRPVLKMYLNGKVAKILKCNGEMHGDVYPCVSVAGGCMLEANFEGSLHEFQYGPPQGYCGIMYTRDIL